MNISMILKKIIFKYLISKVYMIKDLQADL